MRDVIIIGNGITGNLAACFLRQKCPDLDVLVVGRTDKALPIVGESLVEISTHFMRDLGLGQLLVEKHFPKYGLTFYYKTAPDDPGCRRYVVDEAPAIPPLPSFQLNRFTFDPQIRAINAERGVEHLEANVKDIELGRDGATHTMRAVEKDGTAHDLEARFVIDATGRRCLLGRKMKLIKPKEEQRSAFWFRLVDFDDGFLDTLDMVKKENMAYDAYYATHHFFGRGNWIWAIPMRTDEYRNMISIGITWRPDLYEGEVRSIDDFMARVAEEHPAITDMVASGTVLEKHLYRNYLYTAEKRYSEDGWFMLGDAADTVDPLYSSGLVMVSLQVRQIGEMISRMARGERDPRLVADFDRAYDCFYGSTCNEVTDLYPVMHHPWKCHMRQHVTVLAAFHLGVPMMALDYFSDPDGVKLFAKFADPEQLRQDFAGIRGLIDRVGDRIEAFDPDDYLKVQSADSMNWDFFEYTRETDVPESIARLFTRLAALRMRLLSRASMRDRLKLSQGKDIAADLGRAFAMGVVLRQRRILDNPGVRWLIEAR